MISSGEEELRDAFNQFSLWTLVRHVESGTSVNLMWCGTIQLNLRNYMLAVSIDRVSGQTEYTLLEHYLTKSQYLAVTQSARDDAKRTIGSFLNILPQPTFVHYVNVTNEHPTVDVTQPDVTLLKTVDMTLGNVSSIASGVLCAISAAREMEGALERNVYDMCFSSGKTMREELLRWANGVERVPDVPSYKQQYCFDALPMNSIELDALAKDLCVSSNGGAPLGLFLVRQGELDDVKRYLKRNCVDRLEDVTADTWFLVSQTVPFDTHFPKHASVHEVVQLQDYGVIFWQRSRGTPTPIGKYFRTFFWDMYDSVPPAPGWLNVLVSNETDGSTTYVEKVVTTSKESDPFRMVAFRQLADMIEVLRQQDMSTLDKLCAFFGAQTEIERSAVARGLLLLTVDHAFVDNEMGFSAQMLVDFFNTIEKDQTFRLRVWIVGNDRLWQCFANNCKHASIKYAMPPLDESKREECLSLLLDERSPSVEVVQECMAKYNSKKERGIITENIFFLAALADTINGNGEECVPPTAYWWIEAMERFVWKNVAPKGSSVLQALEHECYNRFVSVSETCTPIYLRIRGKPINRTLVKLLAANYLVQHPHMIDVEKYRLFGHELLDLLLFRHSPIGIAVVQHDTDTVRETHTNSRETLVTATDCLQRNLLHIVHECKDTAELLLSAGVAMEQRCPQLNSWTPLQVADNRGDWPLVDRLLANGATMPADNLRLHQMALSELKEVFSDCICHGCDSLLQWIVSHRPDYQISQEDVYTLVVMQEFNDEVRFRLLAHAVDQRLPEREPEPYQFIWYNTALDTAIEDDRYDLASFLVEKLHFPPTANFYAMQKQYLERSESENAYKTLYKLCTVGNVGEVRILMEENVLDPAHEYNGTNLFIQAAGSGNLELVKFLYERHDFKDRIDEEDKHGDTAMSMAMQRGCAATIRFLHECGATVNPELARSYPGELPEDAIMIDTEDFASLINLKKDKLEQLDIDYNRVDDGDLLLHYYIGYVEATDEDTFRYLLAQYADVDVRTSAQRGGLTPLHVALKFGNERCAAILIEAGADVHAKSLVEHSSSLHFAIMGGIGRPMLRRLIEEHGMDVNTRDRAGQTIAFHLPPYQDVYRWLIHRYGLDLYARDHRGNSILHHRVQTSGYFGRSEIEFLLAVLRFPQGLTNSVGRLALHYAAEEGTLEIVRLLITYRPDLVVVPDGEGLTSVQLARKGGNLLAIKELLESVELLQR